MSDPAAPLLDESPLAGLIAGIERARKHTVWSLLALVAGTGLCWTYSSELFAILALPLTRELAARGDDARLAFTGLTDPFILYFTLSLVGGAIVASPLLLLQVFTIIAPRVQRRRTLAAVAFVLAATGLFLSGISFCYFVLLPFAVRYLLQIGGDFAATVTVRDFLTFTVRLLLAMGLAAQLPLISFAGARLGLVDAGILLRWFPYAVLMIFILAAWVTPPDVLSQILVAVPLIGLYLVGVVVASLAARRD